MSVKGIQGVKRIRAGREIESRVSDGKVREKEIKRRYSAPYKKERESRRGIGNR